MRSTMLRSLLWLLLAASFATNIFLWRAHTLQERRAPVIAADNSPSAPPAHSAPPLFSARPPSLDIDKSLPVSPLARSNAATRSHTFRSYADVLAEDVKTNEHIAALNQLLARWVATDPTAAAEWLAQHDEAIFYDPAALHVTNHLVSIARYAEAFSWMELIRDPVLRENARDAIIAESYRAKKIDDAAVHLSGLPVNRVKAILNGSRLD